MADSKQTNVTVDENDMTEVNYVIDNFGQTKGYFSREKKYEVIENGSQDTVPSGKLYSRLVNIKEDKIQGEEICSVKLKIDDLETKIQGNRLEITENSHLGLISEYFRALQFKGGGNQNSGAEKSETRLGNISEPKKTSQNNKKKGPGQKFNGIKNYFKELEKKSDSETLNSKITIVQRQNASKEAKKPSLKEHRI